MPLSRYQVNKKGIFSIRNGKILLFLAPALIIYSMFMAIPLIMSMKMSLYSSTGIGAEVFVGLDNFIALFFDPLVSERFWNAMENNI